ncbi:MAG TPA: LytTR family DNA-binding domain-containing protein [Kofleriaceae bacterium]|nr:LytTR family DNA-binding domain-containing protein [Kofleriaceae bacterium]
MKLRVLVADDEQPARRRLTDLIARRPDLELAGTSADGREAIEAILTGAPDLVLLDVQMPELTGLDVVRTIGAERMPPVIFVTAHDRYALRAFELAAVDYLLKPFDDARFEQAARRAHELIRLRTTDELRAQLVHLLAASDGARGPAAFIERIAVRERREIRIVAVADIDYIAASGPYAEIHVAGEALLHRERMQSLEELLDPARFCRVHRSAIVNLARIAAIEPQPSGDSTLRLHGGAVLRVSRARLAELTARLGIG